MTGITIEENIIDPPNLDKNLTLNELIDYWLSNKEIYYINQTPFSSLYKEYLLDKPDSYTNTRTKRFYSMINKELLKSFSTHAQIPLVQKEVQHINQAICNWLLKHTLRDNWQSVLNNRLSSRQHNLAGYYIHQVQLQTVDNIFELKCLFKFIHSELEKEKIIFEGESLFQLKFVNQKLRQLPATYKAELFDEQLKEDFKTPTLGEQVSQHLRELQVEGTLKKEINILTTARDYYLNNASAQELKQSFISEDMYSIEFEDSKCYQLIKAILKKKPIQGFSLE